MHSCAPWLRSGTRNGSSSRAAFARPEQVLDYVGRYTHRVAISNNRLESMDDANVSFRWKDYRDYINKYHDADQVRNSSAAFCCTSFPGAVNGSVTTASSPIPAGSRSSPDAENCSPTRSRRHRPTSLSFPAVGRKKTTAAFDGGRITSDSGVMLLG